MRALLDTSVFIASETGRPLGELPDEVAISVITLAELELGVLNASDTRLRAQRLQMLVHVQQSYRAIPITPEVASRFASIVAQLKASGRKAGIHDAWIAATALAHGAAVATQDDDFDAIPGLTVVKV